MNDDSTGMPETVLGSLSACLVEGDSEQRHGALKVRRRAIFLSVVLQSAAFTAIMVFPLLGKGARLPVQIFAETPPFRLGTNHHHRATSQRVEHSASNRPNFPAISISIVRPTQRDTDTSESSSEESIRFDSNPVGDANGIPGSIAAPEQPPAPPSPTPTIVQKPSRFICRFDPARIAHRLEPIYPALGIQLRRETRVELHAIIGTDGSIRALQVISGDPLFYQSALDAVRQWRYTSTLVNGRAVEVDTQITVIYSLRR